MAVLKYYNTTTSAWEYIAASTTANFTSWKKTMAGGETSVSGTDDNSVTLSYTVGLEQVFINGVLQVRGSDYTATDGTSVTGLSALVASDIVTVVCYAPFNVANTIAPTLVDAKGDLLVGTGADAVGRLAVGVDTAYLRPDSTASTGLKWDNDTWTSYTPTYENLTLGNGTMTARYKQIGKTVVVNVGFSFGSTSSISGSVKISIPVTAKNDVSYTLFPSWMFDTSVGTQLMGSMILEDSTKLTVIANKSDGTYVSTTIISSTIPWTWATGDRIAFAFVYEAA
jgi:hypothetical protein